MLNLNTLSLHHLGTTHLHTVSLESPSAAPAPRFGLMGLDTVSSSSEWFPARLQQWAKQFMISLLPGDTLRRIEDLTPARLRNWGDIQGVIFDLDDTLMPLLSGKFPPAIIHTLQQMQAAGIKMGIVTNNIQPEYCRRARLQLAEAGLRLPFIQDSRKPDPAGFQQMGERLGLKASHIAVVGDGILSDVRCANLLGMKSVRALWFRPTVLGMAASYLQDALAITFNGLRHFFTGRSALTILEPSDLEPSEIELSPLEKASIPQAETHWARNRESQQQSKAGQLRRA